MTSGPLQRLGLAGLAFLFAATLSGLAGEAQAAAPAPASEVACVGDFTHSLWPPTAFRETAFHKGNQYGRSQTVAALDNYSRNASLNFESIHCGAANIGKFYDARASRQQTFMDLGSGGVLLGSSGAALSGGAGSVTQGYWGAAALAPAILAQFNAYEPTRDLFHSGGVALRFMSARYEAFERDAGDLDAAFKGGGAKLPGEDQLSAACTALAGELSRMPAWGDTANRATLLPEAERLWAECGVVDAQLANLRAFNLSVVGWRTRAWRLYGKDVVGLDQQMTIQDRALRYTPIQAVSVLAASPFLAVGSILSNENSKAAVDALKSQAAVKALNIDLSPIELTPTPAGLQIPVDISPGAKARLTATAPAGTKASVAALMTKQAVAAFQALDTTRRALVVFAPEYNRRAELARRLAANAAGGKVEASYDPTTRMIKLVFRPTGTVETGQVITPPISN